MILTKDQVFGTGAALGLVISVWSENLKFEYGVLYPIGANRGAPVDLEAQRLPGEPLSLRVVPKSPNGEAFLALLAE